MARTNRRRGPTTRSVAHTVVLEWLVAHKPAVYNASVTPNGFVLIQLINFGGAAGLSTFQIHSSPTLDLNAEYYNSGNFNITKDDSVSAKTWTYTAVAIPSASPASAVTVSASVSAVAVSSSAAVFTAPAVTSTVQPDAGSNGVHPGVIAAVVIVLLFICTALAFFLFRARRKLQKLHQTIIDPKLREEYIAELEGCAAAKELEGHAPVELGTGHHSTELEGCMHLHGNSAPGVGEEKVGGNDVKYLGRTDTRISAGSLTQETARVKSLQVMVQEMEDREAEQNSGAGQYTDKKERPKPPLKK